MPYPLAAVRGGHTSILAAAFNPLTVANLESFYEVDSGFHTTAGSATNLLAWSQYFAAWSQNVSVTLTNFATLDPNGEFPSATLFTPQNDTGARIVQNINVDALTAKTLSIWAKRGPGHNGTSHVFLYIYDGSFRSTSFVPTTNWTRYSVTLDALSEATSLVLQIRPDDDLGTQPVYFWGAQLEYAASPSTYIANGSAVGAAQALMLLDQTANGRHYYAGASETPPTYQAAQFNAYPSLKAVGDVRMDAIAGFGVTTGFTWIQVHKVAVGAGSTVQFGAWGKNEANGWQLIEQASDSNPYTYVLKIRKAGDLFDNAVSDNVAIGTHVVIFTVLDGGATHLYVDGVEVTTGLPTAPTIVGAADQFKIFSTGNVGTVHVAAEAWLSRAITPTEVAQYTSYFTAKYL